MKNDLLYDPSNIESILIHRNYIDLSEKEKELVMNEISSESEYEALRSTLLKIRDTFSEEEDLIPDSELRNSLLTKFEAKHNKPKTGWLETLFPVGKSIFFAPGFQLATIALLVTSAALIFNYAKENNNALARNNTSGQVVSEDKESSIVEPEIKSEIIPPSPPAETLPDKTPEPAKILETEKASSIEVSQENQSPLFGNANEILNEKDLKQEPFSIIQMDKVTDETLENKRDNNNLMQGMAVEKRSEEQLQSKSMVIESLTEREDSQLFEDEYDRSKTVSKKSSKGKELPPPVGVSLKSTPKVLDLLFTSL